eukprot:14960195-Alexandrium_andersonii.AAC.1
MDEATRDAVVARTFDAAAHAAASEATLGEHMEKAAVLLGLRGEPSLPRAPVDEEKESDTSSRVNFTPSASAFTSGDEGGAQL